MTGRALGPVAAAAIGLVGALAATLSLSRAASESVDRVLEERLKGAGESAAALLDDQVADGDTAATSGRLRAVMAANLLDGVYLLSPSFRIVADASGSTRTRPDLLRMDIDRVRRALSGAGSIAPAYTIGTLTVMAGYFPLLRRDGTIRGVLVLEAGQIFVAARAGIARARVVAVSLSLLSALGLAAGAARWTRAENERRRSAARVASIEMLSRVAAMAAHEIRNPLGVIRGTVDLMRERTAATMADRDRRALDDISAEVERLRRLTQDLLDLAADRPLDSAPTAVGELISEAARATEATFPEVRVRYEAQPLPIIEADPTRLRQVFANLLVNAAEAQLQGEVAVTARVERDVIRITVSDRGPGVPPGATDNLFAHYYTSKSTGTGLGLAVARGIVERHGGTLEHLADRRPGATFEIRLPLRRALPTTSARGGR